MRKAVVILALVTLVSAGTFGSSVAQDAGYGGRVEVPDSGLALTLPDDWVYLLPTSETMDSILGFVEEMEDDPLLADQLDLTDMSVTLLAYGPTRSGVEAGDTCSLMTLAPAVGPVLLDLWVANELTSFASEDAVERPSVSYLDIPVGRVARLDFDTDDWAGQLSNSGYLVPGDHSQHWFNCCGEERPEDSWLSIAETIEWLSAED